MALSAGDLAECKEIARAIVKEVLAEHVDSCPHGRTLQSSKMFLVGACVGSGLASGGLVLGLSQLIFGT